MFKTFLKHFLDSFNKMFHDYDSLEQIVLRFFNVVFIVIISHATYTG